MEGLCLQVAEEEDGDVLPAAATQCQPAEDAAAFNSTNHILLSECQPSGQGTVSEQGVTQDMHQQCDLDLLAAVEALLPEWTLTLPVIEGLENSPDPGRLLTAL